MTAIRDGHDEQPDSVLPAIGVGIAALCSELAVRWVATPVFAFIAIFSLAALVAGPHLGAA